MTKPLTATRLRNEIRAIDPTLTVELKNVRVNGATFGCTGFISDSRGNFVYLNTDHNHGTRWDKALYRTAKNAKDFTGGVNHYSTYAELAEAAVDLLHITSRDWSRV